MLYNLARKIRTDRALKFIKSTDWLLDVGCGEDYYLVRQRHRKGCGIERDAEQILPILNEHYESITLLAVIEHLDDPKSVLYHCCRLLRKGGKIIITTPTWLGNFLTPLVSWHDSKEHKRVMSLEGLKEIVPKGYEVSHYEVFEWGLNQLFVIEEIWNLKCEKSL